MYGLLNVGNLHKQKDDWPYSYGHRLPFASLLLIFIAASQGFSIKHGRIFSGLSTLKKEMATQAFNK